MPVDVDRCRLAWGIVSGGRSIVADKWHYDTGITQLVFDVLHIVRVRKRFDVGRGSCILVLWLNEDDWATIGDLSPCDALAYFFSISLKDC